MEYEPKKESSDFSFGVILRCELTQINELLEFLKTNKFTIAHKSISTEKLWITEKPKE